MSQTNDNLQAFQQAYSALFTLLATYPTDKQDKLGACGYWSPKQILAHLSGWLLEAVANPQAKDEHYPVATIDTINAGFVKARHSLTWDEAVADLKQAYNAFIAEERINDWWITVLAEDCRDHHAELTAFLSDDTTLHSHNIPLLEYDTEPRAIIEPGSILKVIEAIPETCVFCFFNEVIDSVCGDGKAEVIGYLAGESGRRPVYALEVETSDGGKQRITVTHSGVGGPMASASLDEMIAYGCRKFIACGGAGVLNREIAVGHIVVPDRALRDEGASYHYLPPSREVTADPDGVAAIEATMQAHNIPYVVGKTWTTDGVYRETPDKIKRRREEGCITVEMEAATFFAVAHFRGVEFAQILYGGDDVSGDVWDHRDWHRRESTRERVFWLAVEAATRL